MNKPVAYRQMSPTFDGKHFFFVKKRENKMRFLYETRIENFGTLLYDVACRTGDRLHHKQMESEEIVCRILAKK